jgi:6-pyruvoyltetrahydropterin/6-carboxytetrahydropterin synthase
MKLGVTEYIDCAHHLPGHERCGSLHGHTKKALRTVLAEYDHKDWNAFLEYPTVENICDLISKRLREKLNYTIHVRVWEGHGKWAEI